MSSSINTNIPSLVASRILDRHDRALSTTLERLATGYRINRGADDPAGLIASELMRSESRAITAAIDNVDAADKIVSVAEGALNEVSSLLVELEGLLDRSANTAALGADEIAANQLQINSILDSIDRISNTTSVKGRNLLDGSLGYNTTGVDSGAIATYNINGALVPAGGTRTVSVNVTGSAQTAILRHSPGAAALAANATIRFAGEYGAETISLLNGTALTDVATAINQSTELTGVSATVTGAGASSRLVFASTNYGDAKFVTVETISGTFATTDVTDTAATRDTGQDATVTINGSTATTDGLEASVRTSTLSVDMMLHEDLATKNGLSATSFTITGGGANFSLSPTIGMAGAASLGIDGVDTSTLGNSSVGLLTTLRSGQANDLNSENFATAQRILRQAQADVSNLRGQLGSFQKNTLATTRNSLEVAYENLMAAESAIRDTDFAHETSRLTRTQILVNATATTLQLANAAPQNVLLLLQ